MCKVLLEEVLRKRGEVEKQGEGGWKQEATKCSIHKSSVPKCKGLDEEENRRRKSS